MSASAEAPGRCAWQSAGDPAAVRQLAPVVRDGLHAALDDLRDLARGIYPPLLAGRLPRHDRPLLLRQQPPVHRHRRRNRFDTASTRNGTGLQGMADWLAALGGAVQVRSRPGHGTILSGELPLTASGQG
jgi:hypothetical protein